MIKNKPIYHITHINNLENILKDNTLWCDAERIKRKYKTENIAYEHLKQRRFTTSVRTAAKGVLADYVPFYFCNRSPMLCAIYKGGVTNDLTTQSNIIYFVSSIEKIVNQSKYSWCFTDGHGVDSLTEFYNDFKELNKIDWTLITDWQWHNTLEDNDRMRRKQAEFLIHHSFSLEEVEKIGVHSQEQKKYIESILAQYSCKIPVTVEKRWYYSRRGLS